LTSDELFSAELREELAALPRPHPSFLVSLLTREEPAIQAFRSQIVAWWNHLATEARIAYTDRLRSLENEDFFQAFGELAVHEILRYHDIRVLKYPDENGSWMEAAAGDDDARFGLGVISYLPEVQIRGSMSVYRHLVRELNQIHHHYYFSVYLKRWLPYDFDPRPIKRALEVWLDSLDDGSWHGKYAEYRDENIHLEFSILDKLSEDRRNLVRFRISPLRAPEVLDKVVGCVDTLVERLDDPDGEHDLPLVATIFSNEDWALPEMFLQDFLYGKPDYAFNWTTHGGRTERLKAFTQSSSKYGVFSLERYQKVSAVVLADKEWERDKVVFSLKVLHNPWANKPLPPEFFSDFAQYRTIDRDGDSAYLAWRNQNRTRFRLR
jgi:hypothetical protein